MNVAEEIIEKLDPPDDDEDDDEVADQHQEHHKCQAQAHDHGDFELCDENFGKGRTSGLEDTVAHYEEIPSITELREEYDLSQATINIVP